MTSEKPVKLLYIKNAIRICNQHHRSMQNYAEASLHERIFIKLNNPFIAHLSQRIHNTTRMIEIICQKNGAFPADLPERSYRAYLWLRFLSEPQRLLQHLLALQDFIKFFHQEKKKNINLQINIANTNYLFRSTLANHSCKFVAAEGFIAADSAIKRYLIQTLFHKNTYALSQIRQFSQGKTYQHIMQMLWQYTEQSALSTRGHYYDLMQIFQRANSQYFQNVLQPPRLLWSSRISLRRLGYYHPDMDTITISRALDSKSVPQYVLDYVMYHEILHKVLGLKLVNKNRMAHTRQFRDLERKFRQYQPAKKFIENMLTDRNFTSSMK